MYVNLLCRFLVAYTKNLCSYFFLIHYSNYLVGISVVVNGNMTSVVIILIIDKR